MNNHSQTEENAPEIESITLEYFNDCYEAATSMKGMIAVREGLISEIENYKDFEGLKAMYRKILEQVENDIQDSKKRIETILLWSDFQPKVIRDTVNMRIEKMMGWEEIATKLYYADASVPWNMLKNHFAKIKREQDTL